MGKNRSDESDRFIISSLINEIFVPVCYSYCLAQRSKRRTQIAIEASRDDIKHRIHILAPGKAKRYVSRF